MLFVLSWVFCVFTTPLAFGMSSFEHLFMEHCGEPFPWNEMSSPMFSCCPYPLEITATAACSMFTMYAQSCHTYWKWDRWKEICHLSFGCSLPTSNSERSIIWESSRCFSWCVCRILRFFYACLIIFSLKRLSLVTRAGSFGIAFLEQQICLSDPRWMLPVHFLGITPNGESHGIIS